MFDVSAIEQVLLLAKNARGLPSAIDLVSDALARTDLFVFGELQDLPLVQQLKDNAQFRPWFAALELFSYGKWADYIDSMGQYPELSDAQILKLKQLTVIAMAQSSPVLLYSELKEALNIKETRDLEDFLINNCFNCRILEGKLNQSKELLLVEDSINRDVRVEDFPEIRNSLKTWFESTERSLDDILGRIVFTKEAVNENERRKQELNDKAEQKMKEIKDQDGMRMDAADVVASYFEDRESKARR